MTGIRLVQAMEMEMMIYIKNMVNLVRIMP